MCALKNVMKSWQHVRYRFFNTSRRHEKLIKLFSIRAAFHHHVQFFFPGSLSSDRTTTLAALGHTSCGKPLLLCTWMWNVSNLCSVGNIPQCYICTLHLSRLHGEKAKKKKKKKRSTTINIPASFFLEQNAGSKENSKWTLILILVIYYKDKWSQIQQEMSKWLCPNTFFFKKKKKFFQYYKIEDKTFFFPLKPVVNVNINIQSWQWPINKALFSHQFDCIQKYRLSNGRWADSFHQPLTDFNQCLSNSSDVVQPRLYLLQVEVFATTDMSAGQWAAGPQACVCRVWSSGGWNMSVLLLLWCLSIWKWATQKSLSSIWGWPSSGEGRAGGTSFRLHLDLQLSLNDGLLSQSLLKVQLCLW